MPEPFVIGSVPYLNAKPLIRWFDTPEGRNSGVEVIEAPPSQLARMLEANEISVAMVSSFECFRRPDLAHVPGVSISGRDEIKSVRAFAKLPFGMIQTVAMDSSSLTSVALLTILLSEVYRVHPQHLSMPPNLERMLAAADACLLIGDNGMLARSADLEVMDLGEAWRKLTGLPFVYAMWIGKPDRITPRVTEILQKARDYGVDRFDEIAADEAVRLGCSAEVCLDYFENVMDYELGPDHLHGLETFRAKVFANNLLGESRVAGPIGQRIME